MMVGSHKKSLLKRREGQAAIEFIVVVVVILFFLLFFLSLSILLTVSDYIEYATFMSARTYKSMFESEEIQERNARTVFDAYTSRIQGIARNFNLEFLPGQDQGNQAAGVRVNYDIDMFYLPPVFMPEGAPTSQITLTSETRLGRDPSYQDCNGYFQRFVGQFPIGADRLVRQMDDNGC